MWCLSWELLVIAEGQQGGAAVGTISNSTGTPGGACHGNCESHFDSVCISNAFEQNNIDTDHGPVLVVVVLELPEELEINGVGCVTVQMALVDKIVREIFNAALDVMCDSFPDLNRRDLSGAVPVVKVLPPTPLCRSQDFDFILPGFG